MAVGPSVTGSVAICRLLLCDPSSTPRLETSRGREMTSTCLISTPAPLHDPHCTAGTGSYVLHIGLALQIMGYVPWGVERTTDRVM